MHLELNNSVNSNLFIEQDTANSFIPLYCTVLKSKIRQTLRLNVFKDIEENGLYNLVSVVAIIFTIEPNISRLFYCIWFLKII